MVLALDFDGTLVTSFTARPLAAATAAVARIDSDLPVAIVTNQAGPTFRMHGSTRHPSPSEVAETLDTGLRAVGLPPQRVAHLLACTWPGETWRGNPATAAHAAAAAATALSDALHTRGWSQAYVTSAAPWRKPAPGMLIGLASRLLVAHSSILYVGDMRTDEQAARAAGCRFQYARDWWAGRGV